MAAFRVQTVSPVGGSHHPLALLADILALFSKSKLWKENGSGFKPNIFSFSSGKRRTMKYFLKLKKNQSSCLLLVLSDVPIHDSIIVERLYCGDWLDLGHGLHPLGWWPDPA